MAGSVAGGSLLSLLMVGPTTPTAPEQLETLPGGEPAEAQGQGLVAPSPVQPVGSTLGQDVHGGQGVALSHSQGSGAHSQGGVGGHMFQHQPHFHPPLSVASYPQHAHTHAQQSVLHAVGGGAVGQQPSGVGAVTSAASAGPPASGLDAGHAAGHAGGSPSPAAWPAAAASVGEMGEAAASPEQGLSSRSGSASRQDSGQYEAEQQRSMVMEAAGMGSQGPGMAMMEARAEQGAVSAVADEAQGPTPPARPGSVQGGGGRGQRVAMSGAGTCRGGASKRKRDP